MEYLVVTGEVKRDCSSFVLADMAAQQKVRVLGLTAVVWAVEDDEPEPVAIWSRHD